VRDSTGVVRLAPLLFVSSTQINFQVPGDTALGETTLAIANGVETAVAGSMQVEAMAPGLFTVQGSSAAITGVRVEPDGRHVPVAVIECDPIYGCAPSAVPLSTASGSLIYLSFFATYAGPQETPGVDQINIHLAPEVLETIDPLDVVLFGQADGLVEIHIDGMPANPVYIGIR
jgi:hypothetical protein